MNFVSLIGAAIVAASVGSLAQPGMPVSERTRDGKTLVVPDAHRSMGTVYFALTDRDRQVYFESDAPLEKIKGQSNQVIGYAVLAHGGSGGLSAGEWRMPVKSMRTGIKLRDKHLSGSDWLDSGSYPDIIVQVRESKQFRETRRSAAFTAYSGTLVVDVTLHGVTHTVSIPESSVTVMNESSATQKVAKGDLMLVRTKFSVRLSDYGVSHPVIGDKVANEVALDVSLYLSTMAPDKQ